MAPRTGRLSGTAVRCRRCSMWTTVVAALAMCAAVALGQSPDNKPQPGQAAAEKSATSKPTAKARRPADDSAAIKRLILEKLKESPKPATTQPVRQPVEQPTKMTPALRTVTSSAAAKAGEPVAISTPKALYPVAIDEQSQPTAAGELAKQSGQPSQKSGCGPPDQHKLDLTPPPPDQPQPVWVCEQETAENKPVWRGEKATFVFKVRNDGKGVLNIELRGG